MNSGKSSPPPPSQYGKCPPPRVGLPGSDGTRTTTTTNVYYCKTIVGAAEQAAKTLTRHLS
ncbi:hypothetical protein IF1G_08544 [Cordyceps javanica]|uniref:Uncharacterized protein n=1 Tax=Cordyceps javanica TaxID=43265 RepID=A0A545UT41_9HYPO|nr:hypothetical protein IF1G_08544 [Cordyceps javanica]